MKKILLPFLLMILFMTGCASEKLTVGLDDDFEPLGFRDERGEIVGFDVDLAKEAGKRLGVEIIFRPIDWDKKREEITSGNVDLIWNGLDITDERKEYMIFSKPYMDDRQIFLVKKGSRQNIHSEGDLEGKIVGTQAGSTAENYLHETEILTKNFKEFKTYLKFKDGLNALLNEEIDVFICDELIARYNVSKHFGQFDIIDVKTGYPTEVGIGFRKDNVELRDRVQKVFDEMIKDGTAKKISMRWFQADLIK